MNEAVGEPGTPGVSCQLVAVCNGMVLTDSSADLCEHPSSRLWQQVRVAAACQG